MTGERFRQMLPLGLLACLAVVCPAGASEGERFAVVLVECPGAIPVIEKRPLPVETGPGPCLERIRAIIDPSQDARSRSVASPQPAAGLRLQEKPGWPRLFTGYFGGPITLARLGDPRGLSTVFGVLPGRIQAIAPDGLPLAGWPVQLPGDDSVGSFSAADLLDDERDELIRTTGVIHALSSQGVILPGWPFTGGGFLGTLAMAARFPSDAVTRVIGAGLLLPVSSRQGGVIVFDDVGEPLPGWPAIIPPYVTPQGTFRPILHGPAFADVTGNGVPEIVVVNSNDLSVWVFGQDGEPIQPFPLAVGGILDTPSLGDLDGDGSQEIVFWTDGTDPPNRGNPGIIVLDGRGVMKEGWPQVTIAIGNDGPAIGDVDGDGRLEILASTVGGDQAGVYLWHDDGTPVSGWPKFVPFTSFPDDPIIADVDGDGVGDIIVAGFTTILPSDGVLYAWTATGDLIAGFPMVFPFRGLGSGSPVVADIDGDGMAEISISTTPGIFVSNPATIHWFDLGVPYRPEGMQWPNVRHDMARTSSYRPPVRSGEMEVQIAPPALSAGTPAPEMTVLVRLPEEEKAETAPQNLSLVEIDGESIEPLPGTRLNGRGLARGGGDRLIFRFAGEAVRERLGGPGPHQLTFRTEVIGGLGGIRFKGTGSLTLREAAR